VKQDYAEAVRWFTKSAEQGNAQAQYRLDVLNKKMGIKND
jgi:TPR repeat protein